MGTSHAGVSLSEIRFILLAIKYVSCWNALKQLLIYLFFLSANERSSIILFLANRSTAVRQSNKGEFLFCVGIINAHVSFIKNANVSVDCFIISYSSYC